MWSQEGGRGTSWDVIVKVANSGTKGNQSGTIYQPPCQLPNGTSCFRSFISKELNYSSKAVQGTPTRIGLCVLEGLWRSE